MKMELMSSLLLFALTIVPQALGKTNIFSYGSELNDSVVIADKIKTVKEKDVLITKVSDMQSVFTDHSCINCSSCMERAILDHSNYMNSINIENENEETNIRDKRASASNIEAKVDRKSKRPKSRKHKSISVTKLGDKEKIYGLKITESSNVLLDRNSSKTKTSCQVYSVKKSFPCESPEADIFLKESKRKINKKSKKEQSKKETESDKATVIAPVFRKRQIDDSQVPEQIMPSIEEMY